MFHLEKIVARLNRLDVDLVCLTGDLVDEEHWLGETLEILAQLKKPLYAVRGNHDCWEAEGDGAIQQCCRATGGRWLLDERAVLPGGRGEIIGSRGNLETVPAPAGGGFSILLVHDPAVVERLSGVKYSLILAGHTHGGQLRFPGGGPWLSLPFIGKYDRGLYETPGGPLYVNPGLGTFMLPARFACRPELTIIHFTPLSSQTIR